MKIEGLCAAVALAMALGGCVALPGKSVSGLREVALERAEVPPGKDWIVGQRVKVVVSSPEGNEWPDARQAQLLPLFSSSLEKAVEESGSEVIDRSLNTALKDEMRLAEAKGSGSFDGPAVAHYAVKPALTKVAIDSVREERGLLSKMIRKNDPPVYNHLLVVEGRIRVYEIPSMRLVETLQFKEEQKEDNALPHLPNVEARLRDAFEKAYGRVRSDFKNLIAPRGAVLKKGMVEGGPVFQVMMGSEHKIVPRARVRVFSQSGGQVALVAEGVVTSDIGARSCWISIDDSKAADRVREGDIARVVIDDSLLGKLKVW